MKNNEHAFKILIVEDQPDLRIVLRDILEDEGFSVLIAGTAEDGLQYLKTEVIDLLISDIGLPGMDGWQLVEHAKRHQNNLSVVMITSWDDNETGKRKKETGVLEIIHKPFRVIELLRAIETLAFYHPDSVNHSNKIG